MRVQPGHGAQRLKRISQNAPQVVSAAAPAQGSGLPLLAARLCFLLLLVPPAAWDAIPDEQVVTAAEAAAAQHALLLVPLLPLLRGQFQLMQMQADCLCSMQ